MELTLELGLADQYDDLLDMVRAVVYSARQQQKAIAAELDTSPSKLRRMLAEDPDDPLKFPVEKLPALMRFTQDFRPIYWLIEKFLDDPEKKHKRVVDELAGMLPRLQQLLSTANGQ